MLMETVGSPRTSCSFLVLACVSQWGMFSSLLLLLPNINNVEEARKQLAARQSAAALPEEADSPPGAARGTTVTGKVAPAAPDGMARLAA